MVGRCQPSTIPNFNFSGFLYLQSHAEIQYAEQRKVYEHGQHHRHNLRLLLRLMVFERMYNGVGHVQLWFGRGCFAEQQADTWDVGLFECIGDGHDIAIRHVFIRGDDHGLIGLGAAFV